MRLAHISDLHLGKRLNGYSLIDDQKYILDRILDIVTEENADGIMIAGDIFDKSAPSAEAVAVFDEFLTSLKKLGKLVFMISGNHDSAERIAYGGKIMNESDIYISHVYDGSIEKITKNDEYGEINFYLVPFIKPAHIRPFFEGTEINTPTEAFSAVLSTYDIDESKRNVIICHQFFAGAAVCESEELNVGTLDCTDPAVLDKFDYAALGHIHNPQKVKRDTVRYCGTPLKYSISECGSTKSVTIVDLKEKSCVEISTVELVPKRDLRRIKGTYEELMLRDNYINTNTEDYIDCTLTNEQEIPNVLEKLRNVYKNIVHFEYDNTRTRHYGEIKAVVQTDKKSPIELFSKLYSEQNGVEMTEQQAEYISSLIEEIWEVNE